MSNIVRKHRDILNIRRTLQGLFQEEPITAFKINKNLKQLIGSNCMENEKVKRAKIYIHHRQTLPIFMKKW